ncbi:hypothetical protein D3C71_1468480 [compost metagenome]
MNFTISSNCISGVVFYSTNEQISCILDFCVTEVKFINVVCNVSYRFRILFSSSLYPVYITSQYSSWIYSFAEFNTNCFESCFLNRCNCRSCCIFNYRYVKILAQRFKWNEIFYTLHVHCVLSIVKFSKQFNNCRISFNCYITNSLLSIDQEVACSRCFNRLTELNFQCCIT